jgi:hypothetical protein
VRRLSFIEEQSPEKEEELSSDEDLEVGTDEAFL